jgi:hypothetical protein
MQINEFNQRLSEFQAQRNYAVDRAAAPRSEIVMWLRSRSASRLVSVVANLSVPFKRSVSGFTS